MKEIATMLHSQLETETELTQTNNLLAAPINLLATLAPHLTERERGIYEEYALQTSLLHLTYESWFTASRRQLLRFLALTTRQPAASLELTLPATYRPDPAAFLAAKAIYHSFACQPEAPSHAISAGAGAAPVSTQRASRNGKRLILADAKETEADLGRTLRPAALAAQAVTPAATTIRTFTFARSELVRLMHRACQWLFEAELVRRDWLSRLLPNSRPEHARAAFAHGLDPLEIEASVLLNLIPDRLEAVCTELGRGAVDNRELSEKLNLTYNTVHYYKYQLVDAVLLHALTTTSPALADGKPVQEQSPQQQPQPRQIKRHEAVTRRSG